MDRKEATIRKWYQTWGIAHSFVSPTIPPLKFFIHTNNLRAPAVLGLGVVISFVEGQPRTAKELPVALDIDVVVQPIAGPVVKATEAKPVVAKPSGEVKS